MAINQSSLIIRYPSYKRYFFILLISIYHSTTTIRNIMLHSSLSQSSIFAKAFTTVPRYVHSISYYTRIQKHNRLPITAIFESRYNHKRSPFLQTHTSTTFTSTHDNKNNNNYNYNKESATSIQKLKSNKFSRFRNNYHALQASLSSRDEILPPTIITTNCDDPTNNSIPQEIISLLAQKKKTWHRLSNIINLVQIVTASNSSSQKRSIVDVGCDHGLLSIALALTGRFQHVIGIDVSWNALQGSFAFHEKVLEILQMKQHVQKCNNDSADYYDSISSDFIHSTIRHNDDGYIDNTGSIIRHQQSNEKLPLEFRVGDGIQALIPGEADCICIAGMGVDTMVNILTTPTTSTIDSSISPKNVDTIAMKNQKIPPLPVFQIHHLQSRYIVLQPATSRPRHLMLLYKTIQEQLGYDLMQERICYVRSRWYITAAFYKKQYEDNIDDGRQISNCKLPGALLQFNSLGYNHNELEQQQYDEFQKYVNFHVSWLEQDLKRKGNLHVHDSEWLNNFQRQ